MHLNCRSVLYKVGEVNDLLNSLPVSILALTETWLSDHLTDSINIPGYHLIHRSRTSGEGGGVGLLVNENVPHQLYELPGSSHCPKSFESLFIRVSLKKITCIVGVVYRPPDTNLEEFCAEIDQLLTTLACGDKHIIILGDFNVDLLRVVDHSRTNSFFNTMTAHNLLPTITRPTRITSYSASLIDNIFTNIWPSIVESKIIASDISDHLPILTCFNFDPHNKGSIQNSVSRLINDDRRKVFNASLIDADWSSVMDACDCGDANGAYDRFLIQFKDLYDKAFPIVSRGSKDKLRFKQPWMTRGLLKSSRKKANLYLKYVKNPTSANKRKFIKYRNKFKAIRLAAERNYYAYEFSKNCHNFTTSWNLIRSLIELRERD